MAFSLELFLFYLDEKVVFSIFKNKLIFVFCCWILEIKKEFTKTE